MELRMIFVCYGGWYFVSAVSHWTLFGCMMSWSSGMESPSRGRGCRMWPSPVIFPRSTFMWV